MITIKITESLWGIADVAGGAFGSLQVNAGSETSFASKMEACPEYYSSFMTADGDGEFDSQSLQRQN
jgi:hypothetical protein